MVDLYECLDRVASLGIFKEAFVESSTEHCNFLSDKKWSDSNLKDRRALCGYYPCFLGQHHENTVYYIHFDFYIHAIVQRLW